jgi:hypothetical protein
LFPPSPFEAEKARLGGGFCGAPHPRNRAADKVRPVSAARGPHGVRKAGRFQILTDAQRAYIGSTGRETPRAELAERFGVKISYISQLRRAYRRRLDANEG